MRRIILQLFKIHRRECNYLHMISSLIVRIKKNLITKSWAGPCFNEFYRYFFTVYVVLCLVLRVPDPRLRYTLISTSISKKKRTLLHASIHFIYFSLFLFSFLFFLGSWIGVTIGHPAFFFFFFNIFILEWEGEVKFMM